jgi:hypothetical protein
MQYSKEEKAMWLEDWRQSGKSAWAYAKENGLTPQTFVRWIKAEEEPEARTCFVEVPARIMPQPIPAPEIIIEKGDMKIHIPLTIGRGELCAVMEGLGCAL